MDQPPIDPSPPQSQPEPVALPILKAKDLFQGQKEVRIDHQGEIYRLRITSRGRLILQK